MLSIRAKILQHLEDRFAAVEAGMPTDDAYALTWGEVTRKPIKDVARGRRSILGIYPGTEDKRITANVLQVCTMQGVLEAHVTKDDEDLCALLETALLEMERCLMEDKTCGGLAIDIDVTSTDTDIDGIFATHATISLYFTLQYRHRLSRPDQQDYGD